LYLGSYTDKTFKPTHKLVLSTFSSRDDAISHEIELHKAFDVACNPHFANRAIQTSTGFSSAGTTPSEETRKKMSEALKGRQSPQKGKPHSEETRKKLSEALKGENNPLYGKKLSKETRKKISKIHKGKTISEETREKLSEAGRGKTRSVETRKKLSDAKRRNSKRFDWAHRKTSAIHENVTVLELMGFYPDLSMSKLSGVSRGNRPHYKEWTVLLCHLQMQT
jgi:hypothetical protein